MNDFLEQWIGNEFNIVWESELSDGRRNETH